MRFGEAENGQINAATLIGNTEDVPEAMRCICRTISGVWVEGSRLIRPLTMQAARATVKR